MEIWHVIKYNWNSSKFSHVGINVWLHRNDINETPDGKSRLKQDKYVVWCFEQIQEAASYETAIVWPLTPHLEKLMYDECYIITE